MENRGDTAATRPNGRAPSNLLLVNHDTRKPLFSNNTSRGSSSSKTHNEAPLATASHTTGAKVGGTAPEAGGSRLVTRRAKSDPQGAGSELRNGHGMTDPNGSIASLLSPGGTRIPRPNATGLQSRRPISFIEAFKIAQEEEEEAERERQQGGSPSPAPRPWRARPGQPQDEIQARKLLAEDHLDKKSHTRQLTEKLLNARAPSSNSKPSEAGAGVVRSTGLDNNSILQERINEWMTESPSWANQHVASSPDSIGDGPLPELVPGIDDVPFPSIESPARNFAITSPEKSFTWQVDQDFTAGDLQISDSPRIKVGSNKPFADRPSIVGRIDGKSPGRFNNLGARNTKLEEIRARELFHKSNTMPEPQQTRRYTKLEEIRARETAVDNQATTLARSQPRPKNTKLGEIRQREADGLSRRAVAAARLEEIKEKNAMARSVSPEDGGPQTRREFGGLSRLSAHPKSAAVANGEKIPDTPVTVYKGYRSKQENVPPTKSGTSREKDATLAVKPDTVLERELLRRLARAASASPAPEPPARRPTLAERQAQTRSESERVLTKPSLTDRSTDNGRKSALSSRNKDGGPQLSRLAVGFAGLRRNSTTESAKSKRSSMHSETDPTARIEAEMRLFAPLDNYSERGSVRAPSPPSDSDESNGDKQDTLAEVTPKARKHDFASLPTPRITGAYVETPVTAKVEKIENGEQDHVKAFTMKLKEQMDEKDRDVHQDVPKVEPPPVLFRDKKTSLAWRNKNQDTASEPGTSNDRAGDAVTTSFAVGRRRRSRSLPRRRPPVKNSAKLPSVKDDLRELQRQHNIDDSTMDDVGEILTGQKLPTPKLEKLLQDMSAKTNEESDDSREGANDVRRIKEEPESDLSDKDMSAGSMAIYNKMSKSLQTGLLGIRSAKLGIQRLEDQFAHAEQHGTDEQPEKLAKFEPLKRQKQHHQPEQTSHADQCPDCVADPEPVVATYLHFPIPRLYQATPQFRLTLLGLALTVLSLWYGAELAVCARYCRPTACSSTPCIYSYDDPTFGTALPVKLDEWVTGGTGRSFANWILEEVQDWTMDIEDALHGRSLSDVPVDRLTFEERRRHRRRLQKHGLLRPVTRSASSDQKAKWDAWRRSRLVQEQVRDAKHSRHSDARNGWDEENAVGGDERVW